MNYYPPNCKCYLSNDGYDMSFFISDVGLYVGLTAADESRWTTMGAERRERIITALEFLGWLYGPGYSPSFEKTPIGEHLVFNEIEIKYRTFRRRWLRQPSDVFKRFDEEEGLPSEKFNRFEDHTALTYSPKTAYREIWQAFYSDIASKDVYDHFLEWLDYVSMKIDEEDDEQ